MGMGEGIRLGLGGGGCFQGPVWVLTVACRPVRSRAPLIGLLPSKTS